ncbi:hypothetical protein ACMDCR_27450 [Labrys okinawensis]|uniref:hypothetical protein n=1 Tax=Labrys okinawensis TaxID=346911 RepID=UPI0039BCFA0E
MSKARGLFRNENNGIEYARVEYAPDDVVDVPRFEYDKQMFQPAFDELPTFEEYEARDNITSAHTLGPSD